MGIAQTRAIVVQVLLEQGITNGVSQATFDTHEADPNIHHVPGGGGGGTARLDKFSPGGGQTVFVLSATPSPAADVLMFVNGTEYTSPGAFAVVGSTLTWNDSEFVIEASDRVEVSYHS